MTITFSNYQGAVFLRTEELYRTQGFLNTSLFEDTYVLSKLTAEYIAANIPTNGTSVNEDANNVYSAILGISSTAPPPVTGTTSSGGTFTVVPSDDSLLSLSPQFSSEAAAISTPSSPTIVVGYIKPLSIGKQLNVVSATTSPTNNGFFRVVNAFPEAQYTESIIELDANGIVVKITSADTTGIVDDGNSGSGSGGNGNGGDGSGAINPV